MPKALCIISLIVSALILVLFLLNMVAGIPFGGSGSLMGSLGMVFGAAIIAAFSALTFRECR